MVRTTTDQTIKRAINLAATLSDRTSPTATSYLRATIYPETLSNSESADDPRREELFNTQFKRDRKLLGERGIRIVNTPDRGWLLDPSCLIATDINIDENDFAAIYVALTCMLDDPFFPLPTHLRIAHGRLERMWREAYGDDKPVAFSAFRKFNTVEGNLDYFEVLLSCAMSCSQVQMAYQNALGENSERTFNPYGIYLLEGQWYTCGWDSLRRAERTFHIDRITDLETTGKAFKRPPDFSISDKIVLPFLLSGQVAIGQVDLVIPSTDQHVIEYLTRKKGVVTLGVRSSVWTAEYADLDQLLSYILTAQLTFADSHCSEAQVLRSRLVEIGASHA